MAINLLGYAVPSSASSLINNSNPTQTSTAAAAPQSYFSGTATRAGSLAGIAPTTTITPITSQNTPRLGMGINATTPYSNQSSPSTTIPRAQTVTSPYYAGQSGAVAGSASNPYTRDANGNWVLGGTTPQSGTVGSGAGLLANTVQPPTDPFAVTPQQAAAGQAAYPTGTNGQVTSPNATATDSGTTGTSNTTDSTQQYSATNLPTYGGLLAQAANIASGPSQDYQTQQGVANQYLSELERSRANEAAVLGGNADNPIPLEFQQGRAQVLQNQYAGEQGALGAAYQGASNLQGAANTQQQIEQQGLLGAASGAAPVTQFGQLTNPLTGQVVSPQGGNPQLNTAVQQAVQLVKNGASPQDAMAQAGLNTFGLPGQQAFTTAMQQVSNGTYNPTMSGAFAQSSAAQATSYQQQAVQIQNALQSLQNVAPAATSIVSQINSSDSPLKNAPIQQYIASLGNTDAAAQMNLVMADIKKYTGQLLAMNAGGIPTDVSNSMASINPSLLNASQLSNYLQMADYLGNQQKSAIQSQISGLASTPYGGYVGGAPSGSMPGNSANTSYGSGVTGQAGQIAAGVGLGVGSDVAAAATNGGNILSFILGHIF